MRQEILYPESTSSAESITMYSSCIQLLASESVRKYKFQALAATPWFGHTKALHTLVATSTIVCIRICAQVKIPNTGSHIPWFGHMKTLHTLVTMGPVACIRICTQVQIPSNGSHTMVWTHENAAGAGRNGQRCSCSCCASVAQVR